MTLDQLYTQLAPHFPASRRKDMKTAVKVYAQALGAADPQQCPVALCQAPLPTIYRCIDAYLQPQGKSVHTLRNIKNNLSRLFRVAEHQGLLTPAAGSPSPRFDKKQKALRPGLGARSTPSGLHLTRRHWPPQLQADFAAFVHWATQPFVPGREARWRKRASTLEEYQTRMEAYFGYLHHIRHLEALSFEQLFDFALISDYVQWDINEHHKQPTASLRFFLKHLLAITRQYHPDPTFRAQVLALKRTLPVPPPVANKKDAWVSLATLTRIGVDLWPAERPRSSQGIYAAYYAGLSLMFRLWTFIPYRQRNMREMTLHDNLYRDPHGHWRIQFVGEQLKVAMKKGQPNRFDLPFPPALVPTLEAYLATWRPLLAARQSPAASQLFLMTTGAPFRTHKDLRRATADLVYKYTGTYWHPHIVRTVWATEWIRQSHGDFYTAAVMLNDTLQTVIANYAHLLEGDVAEKAYQLIQERTRTGR